ncbi:MAG: hypothetical protein ACJ8DV_25275 [Microvirga sp.]
MMKRRKIWVGLSTAVLAATPATAKAAAETTLPAKPAMEAKAGQDALTKLAQHKGHGAEGGKSAGAKASAASGGEGDEGSGGRASELPIPLRLYRDIGLIRGHLLVGNELVEAGRWAEALPHFLHPEEEIYPGMRENLKTFNVAPFQTALKALSQTVKAKNKEAYARARAALEERVAAAEASVSGKEANLPYFTLETVMEILQTASSEYEEALKGDRIANVVEYQDARGFVFEADRLIAAQADALAAKNADAVKTIRASLSDLKSAFPAPMPPRQAVKNTGQFLSDLSKIELQLSSLR